MYLLLEYLGNEDALKAQVLPVWELHYDAEYIQSSILPQIKGNASLLTQLVSQIKKIAVCERPAKPSEYARGSHGDGNITGKSAESTKCKSESPREQRRRQSAPVPSEMPFQVPEVKNIVRKRFASSILTTVPAISAFLQNRRNLDLSSERTSATPPDGSNSGQQHTASSSQQASNQSSSSVAGSRETEKFASTRGSVQECSDVISQSLEAENHFPQNGCEDSKTKADIPGKTAVPSNSRSVLPGQRRRQKGEKQCRASGHSLRRLSTWCTNGRHQY